MLNPKEVRSSFKKKKGDSLQINLFTIILILSHSEFYGSNMSQSSDRGNKMLE